MMHLFHGVFMIIMLTAFSVHVFSILQIIFNMCALQCVSILLVEGCVQVKLQANVGIQSIQWQTC